MKLYSAYGKARVTRKVQSLPEVSQPCLISMAHKESRLQAHLFNEAKMFYTRNMKGTTFSLQSKNNFVILECFALNPLCPRNFWWGLENVDEVGTFGQLGKLWTGLKLKHGN